MKFTSPTRVRARTFALLTFSTHLLMVCKGNVEAQTYVTLHQKLNSRCRDMYKQLCSQGYKDFCGEHLNPTVRKGVGNPNQNSVEYRCYAENAVAGNQVDFSASGIWCLDDCGNEVRCPGSVKRRQGSFHATRHTEIAKWIEQEKPKYCSSLQRELDARCIVTLQNSVGRIMDSTPNGELVCVSKEALEFYQDAFCFNHCGTPSLCPGKPIGNVKRLPADMKTILLRDFERPCRPLEQCVQPRGMPVQCEEGKGMLIGDGEKIEAVFTSPEVTVTAETCLHAELDLDRRTIRIGREGDSLTTIPVPVTTPPYSLSLQRKGNELKMTLVYNADASGNNTLYYAQPGAACLAGEPLTFTGLNQEAQVSRKNERSISSAT